MVDLHIMIVTNIIKISEAHIKSLCMANNIML